MNSITDDLIDFLECAIHSFLFARKIYPSNLFEQRKYLEVTVWQSRHPDINAYIRRVLDNARPLIEKGVVDRFVVATTDESGSTKDHTTIKCKLLDMSDSASVSEVNEAERALLYEELRSAILRIAMLDAQIPKLTEGCTWNILVITRADGASTAGDGALQAALSSGEWYVDNNMSTEQRSLAQRVSASGSSPAGIGSSAATASSTGGSSSSNSGGRDLSAGAGGEVLSGDGQRPPTLLPVKSFRTDTLDLSVYVHVF